MEAEAIGFLWRKPFAVTPSDDIEIDSRGLYVGTGGPIAVVGIDSDTPIVFIVPDGGTIPVHVRKVMATDTDAHDIVGGQ